MFTGSGGFFQEDPDVVSHENGTGVVVGGTVPG